MNWLIGRKLAIGLGSVLVAFFSNRAVACSVCFGDPESDMAKGASAGVMFMVGVVGTVLLGIAGFGLTWIHRSRRLAALEAPGQQGQ